MDSGYTVQWMLNMELSNRRQREKNGEKIPGCSEAGYAERLV